MCILGLVSTVPEGVVTSCATKYLLLRGTMLFDIQIDLSLCGTALFWTYLVLIGLIRIPMKKTKMTFLSCFFKSCVL